MIFLIRLIYNAVDIYTLILIVYALLSWFPNAYLTSLGRLLTHLTSPILKPLQRLPLQVGPLDLSLWVAVLLVRFVGYSFVRLLLVLT